MFFTLHFLIILFEKYLEFFKEPNLLCPILLFAFSLNRPAKMCISVLILGNLSYIKTNIFIKNYNLKNTYCIFFSFRKRPQGTVPLGAAMLDTRVLDKGNYRIDEENENVKEVKANKSVENIIFVRPQTETETEKEQAPTATDDEATPA